MSIRPEIKTVKVSVSLEDLLGPLGYGKKDDVSLPVLQQILAEKERCESMLVPRFLADFLLLDSEAENVLKDNSLLLDDSFLVEHLRDAHMVAVGICTVGPDIDAHIEACFAQHDFFAAMIADVVGNRAAEELAEACSDFLCSKAAETEIFPLCRVSPGYGKWEVSGQRALFSLLDPAPIGVSLNEFCMMQPKKSVSFLIPLGPEEPVRKWKHSCQECNFKNCAYRRRS
jgi:hypothetical protein